MTSPDRIGQQLPELLVELATPRVPDYVDDLLTRTAATRQLPAWASLERWLPMGAVARPAPLGLPSWRPILVLVALVLALAAATAFIVGSQPRVPAPFGPARNGELIAGSVDGRMVTLDHRSGTTAPRTGDGSVGLYPWFSQDGRRYLFSRKDAGSETLFVANADGSGVKELLTAAGGVMEWWDWAPNGDRVVVTTMAGDTQSVFVVDPTSGAVKEVDFDMHVHAPLVRPNGREIVFKGSTSSPSTTWAYYVSSIDDPAPRALTPVSGTEVFGGSLSPDGRSWAWSKWDTPRGINGVIHLVHVDTGVDRPVPVVNEPGVSDTNPVWLPDGTSLLVKRYHPDSYHNVIIPVGGGEPVVLDGGPTLRTTEASERLISPDGRWILVRYAGDDGLWIYDAATGAGKELDAAGLDGLTWQRLAP